MERCVLGKAQGERRAEEIHILDGVLTQCALRCLPTPWLILKAMIEPYLETHILAVTLTRCGAMDKLSDLCN